MIWVLMDGSVCLVSELVLLVGVLLFFVSGYLGWLVEGGVLSLEVCGCNCFYCLVGLEVG